MIKLIYGLYVRFTNLQSVRALNKHVRGAGQLLSLVNMYCNVQKNTTVTATDSYLRIV